METIEETTVGGIGRWSIGVSNIWDREYQDTRGRKKYGLTANLTIWDEVAKEETELFLGKGGIVDLKDEGRWKITKIKAGRGAENGYVVLRRA